MPADLAQSKDGAVISDSSRPTAATPREYGRMIRRVSRFQGIWGQRNTGSGDGTALVKRGRR